MRLDGAMTAEDIAEALIERHGRAPKSATEAAWWTGQVDGIPTTIVESVINLLLDAQFKNTDELFGKKPAPNSYAGNANFGLF